METQELIASLALAQEAAVTYTDIDQAQDILQINWDTRAVTIPKSITNAGVINDHLSKKLVFCMDRYVCGVDLAEHTFAIHFINVDTWDNKKKKYDECASGVYPVTNIDLSVDGKVTCEWEITNAATQIVGDVVFALHVFTIVDNAFTYHLGTTPTVLDLLNTVNATEHGKNITPDEIEVYIQKMADLSAEIDAKVAAAEAAAERAEAAAANFEVDDTLSQSGKAADAAVVGEKFSQLSSDIDSLVQTGFTEMIITDWESGKLDANGNNEVNGVNIRTANYHEVYRGYTYRFIGMNGNGCSVIFYDENYNKVSSIGVAPTETITQRDYKITDDTIKFMRVYIARYDSNYSISANNLSIMSNKNIIEEHYQEILSDLEKTVKSCSIDSITASNYIDYWNEVALQPKNSICLYSGNLTADMISDLPEYGTTTNIISYCQNKNITSYGDVQLAVTWSNNVYIRHKAYTNNGGAYTDWVCLTQVKPVSTIKGKTFNCLGDSFTASTINAWHIILGNRTGCNFNNYGVAGSSIALDKQNTLSFLSRCSSMDTSADGTIIFGGINDCLDLWQDEITLGSLSSNHDNTTFYGALMLLIDNIQALMPDKIIFGVIPPDFEPTPQYDNFMPQVQNACREIYEHYGIPYADLKKECQEMYRNEYNNSKYRCVTATETNYHPTYFGYKAISMIIQGLMERIIH